MQQAEMAVRRVAGLRQAMRRLSAGEAACILVARDADSRILENVRQAAEQAGVPVRECESMAALGRLCHIAVPCAVAAELRAEEGE